MKVHLKNVRVCFAHNLFTPSKFAGDPAAKEKYQGEFLVDPTSENVKIIKSAIEAEAKREWGEKAAETLKGVSAVGKVWCLRDGDLRERPEYKGKLIVSAKNEMRPLIVGPNREPLVASDGKIYSGCYVNAIIDVKAASKPNKQVYAYLLGVQFNADGERLSGSVAAADDFEEIPPSEGEKVASSGGGAAALFS